MLAFSLRTFVNGLKEFFTTTENKLSDCSVQNVGNISQIHSIDLEYKEYSYKDDGNMGNGEKQEVKSIIKEVFSYTPCMAV